MRTCFWVEIEQVINIAEVVFQNDFWKFQKCFLKIQKQILEKKCFWKIRKKKFENSKKGLKIPKTFLNLQKVFLRFGKLQKGFED